jgi:hypothetical protein
MAKVEGIPVRKGKKVIRQPVLGLARVSQDVFENCVGLYALSAAELRAAKYGHYYVKTTQPVNKGYKAGTVNATLTPVRKEKLVALAQLVNAAKPWRK